MSDLAGAAAAMGVPEALVKRSAEARARATGASVDEILAAWAGVSPAPAATATPSETASAAAPVEGLKSQATSPKPEPVGANAPETSNLEPLTAAVEPRTLVAPPPPSEVSPKEALRYPVVVTVPTSGLTERIVPTLPKWLASMLLLIPLFGLLQLFGATSNDCGEAGELLVDRVTGALVNCDGSPFEGRGTPGGSTDFIALGEQIYTGQFEGVTACQACHGGQGQGGVGPPLTTVRATFSSCLDHIEWVGKGTQGFQNEGQSTYGDLAKPVGGAGTMPGFATDLTAEQIGAVSAFERVRFGGVAAEEALADCGLVEPAPEEGAPADGEEAVGEGEGEAENPAP